MGKFNAKRPDGGGLYIRLKDGDSVEGVFRGVARDFHTVWKDGKTEEASEGAPGASFRFKMNLVLKENGVLVAKIFEGGWKVYEQLVTLEAAKYDLDRTTVLISRKGSTKNDTKYTVMPVKGGELNDDENAGLENVDLIDLVPTENVPISEDPQEAFDPDSSQA